LALARRHRLDAGKKQIEAEGEVGIQVHALAQGYRGLHEPRVAFGWQRLQEEPGAPPSIQQLIGLFPDDHPGLLADEVNDGAKSVTGDLRRLRWREPPAPEDLQRDLEGMAEVRRLGGVPVMTDEAVLDARDALQAVQLRACDLINIKLMKCGGLLAALTLDAVAETAGVGCQVGTMVESSVASAAGLHLALALHNAATVEVGGPIMLAEDVGDLRAYYEHARVTVPAAPGLGVEPEEAVLKRYAGQRD
jgi:hypothetical protein